MPQSEEGVVWPTDWSNDGRFILGPRAIINHPQRQIALVDTESGTLRIIKTLPEGLHADLCLLSPDGQYLAYETRTGEGEPRNIHIMSIDGRFDQPIIDHEGDDWAPEWSPDGQTLLFASERSGKTALWSIPVTDGIAAGEPRLAHQIGGTGFESLGITNDGTYYFGTSRSTNNVYVADLDREEGIVRESQKVVSSRYAGASQNRHATWSPDGSRLAYLSRRDASHPYEGRYLVLHDVSSGEEQEFEIAGLSRNHCWSPDGTSVLVTIFPGGQRTEVLLVDIQTDVPDKDRAFLSI